MKLRQNCVMVKAGFFFGVILGLSLAAGLTPKAAHAAQANQATSDFLSLCKMTLQDKSPSDQTCHQVNELLFANKGNVKEFSSFTPKEVGAPPSPIDSKVLFLAFNDPNYVAGIGYCYFVYRHWINPKEISPDSLGLNGSGFAILNEDLKGYQKWIDLSREGKACKARVEKESEVPVTHLEASLKNYVAVITVNPLALVREKGADFGAIMQAMALTVNHERIHAFQVLCPSFENWSKSQWASMSAAEHLAIQKKYPSYNWMDPKVAARESAAFALESKPAQVLELTAKCRF